MPKTLVLGYTFAFLAATSYAFASALMRATVFTYGSQWVGAVVSLLIGTAIIAAVDARTFDRSVLRQARPFWLLVGAGVTSGVAVLAAYTAYGIGPVSVVAPFVNLQPLFTALIAHALLGGIERITPRLAIALAMATAGAVLIVSAVS